MYSMWTKSGLSLCRCGVKMRCNLLLHYRNVTKEAVIESVTAFLSHFLSLPPLSLSHTRIQNLWFPPLSSSFFIVFLVETFSQKYDLYRLDKGPPEKSTLNVEDAMYALKTMNYIRRMENRAAELYRQRLINGFLHLYVGQVDEKKLDSKLLCDIP